MADRRIRDTQKLLWSEDNALIKTIQATHGLDDFTFSIRPLLSVIEDIMSLTAHKREDIQDFRDKRTGFFDDMSLGNKNMLDELVLKINHISWEILGKVSSGENIQETVLDILNALSSFFWAGKGVIALAAFAVNYGEFWLVEQLHSTNPVAESLAVLEQLPTEVEQSLMFQEMANLIKVVLNLTKCICESVDLQAHKYLNSDMPVVKNMMVQIPEYTYWIIRSIVTCQSQLSNLNASEAFSSEASSISILVDKVKELGKSMRMQLDLCYQQAEEKRIEDVYQKLKKLNEITSNKDNVKILKALISEEEDMPLYDGSTKTQVRIDTLGKKIVLLYLSELKDLSLGLSFLSQMYLESGQGKPTDYEIVWFPVGETTSLMKPEKKQMFKKLQNSMPWLSLRDLSLLDPAVVKYIKDDWQFERRSMIKVLDQKGRVIKNHDALHMIFIWGSSATPFNGKSEEALWAQENWGIDLLLNFIEPSAIEWAKEGKFICMYGGENIAWIQRFTTTILAISQQAQMPLMMLYMGTNKTDEINNKINGVISDRKLGDIIIEPMKMRLFWTRLESIWHSRVQTGVFPESDHIIQEVFKMRSFECSNRGWAIISKGSEEMAKGMGDTMLKALSEYDDHWKDNVDVKGFVPALDDYMGSMGTSSFCNTFVVPKTKNGLPEKMNCFECRREMRMSTRFNCCGD